MFIIMYSCSCHHSSGESRQIGGMRKERGREQASQILFFCDLSRIPSIYTFFVTDYQKVSFFSLSIGLSHF